jgi:hypothetical protein
MGLAGSAHSNPSKVAAVEVAAVEVAAVEDAEFGVEAQGTRWVDRGYRGHRGQFADNRVQPVRAR